jgi:hypothetical protein
MPRTRSLAAYDPGITSRRQLGRDNIEGYLARHCTRGLVGALVWIALLIIPPGEGGDCGSAGTSLDPGPAAAAGPLVSAPGIERRWLCLLVFSE